MQNVKEKENSKKGQGDCTMRKLLNGILAHLPICLSKTSKSGAANLTP
jgi:hypothetical protein